MQMLYIASQLTYLALVANLGTIVTVLAVLAAMVLFIRQFRLYEFEPPGSSLVIVKNPISEKVLTKIDLPFSLNLGKVDCDSFGDNHLVLYSTSRFPCLFAVCCDVEAETVKSLINEPWPNFKKILQNDMKIWPNLQIHSFEEPHNSKSFSAICPINEHPRSSYALVAFHMRKDEEYESNDDPAAIVTLIHIPDQHCSTPAVILYQYLKCNGGRVLNLKPLYSTSTNEKSVRGSDNEVQVPNGNKNCVICWNFPSSLVLLPCRHSCMCQDCFKRVDNCPICRSRILSYFSI